jgi:hypothetical protein
MRHTILVLAVLFAGATGVRADSLELYSGGLLKFEFRQFPFGPLSGSFHAEGDVLDPSEFPPDADGACTGFLASFETDARLGAFGGYVNPDQSVDLAFMIINGTFPFAPGTYRIDPRDGDVTMGFINNGRGIELPDEFEQLVTFGWREWFDQVIGDHKFSAVFGTVEVTAVEADRVSGTFDEGLMVEMDDGTIISMSEGEFRLTPLVLPVDEISWGAIKGLYRD